MTSLQQGGAGSAQEMAALHKLAHALAGPHNLQTYLQVAAEAACSVLRAGACWIYIYDGVKGDLEFAAGHGHPLPEPGSRIPVTEGPWGRAAFTRRVQLFPDTAREGPARSGALQQFEGISIRSVAASPMQYGGRLAGVLGVVDLENKGQNGVPVETRFLEVLSSVTAAEIYNTRLFDQVRTGRERMQLLSSRLMEAQEQERRAIARELHDEIGQVVTGIHLRLQALGQETDDPEMAEELQESMAMVEHLLQQVRDLSLNLRPSILDDFGLVPALEWLIRRQVRKSGLEIDLSADAEVRPRSEIETVCFRVAQEALTNVVRHAEATRARVSLNQNTRELELEIQDNGVGFDVEKESGRALQGGSLGLLNMRERVLMAGGRFDIESTPGQGTRIRARFPRSPQSTFLERRERQRDSQ